MNNIRKSYIKFVADIGIYLRELFGRFWWYSLVHEKNTLISDVYHNLCLGTHAKKDYSFLDSLRDAVVKYFSFVVRYFIFFRSVRRIRGDELLVTYYGDFLVALKTKKNKYMYVPQKKDWKKIWKEKDCYVIDNFISWFDFVYVLILYFKVTFLFLTNIHMIRNLFESYAAINKLPLNIYEISKEDLYHSFAGDVLIEGIFYDRMFNRMSRKIKNTSLNKKIIYVFEGRNWEKALCYHFSKSGYFVEKIGVVCSAISDNNLQFFYDPIEVNRMPLPEHIGVPGEIPKKKLGEVYGDESVFVLGSNKVFSWITNYLNEKKNEILLVLGYSDKQNLELLEFVKSTGIENVVVKLHPDNKLTKEEIGFEIEEKLILHDKKTVMAVSSTITLDALSCCIPIIVPQLEHYVDFIPIDDTYKGQQFCYRVTNIEELLSALAKVEYVKLNWESCREYVDMYFVFKTREEMRRTIDSL